ncbi:MAG: Clp protease ClpP [Lachnospiraceae bacterium]|jgi:ATP-dependent Clp protease protease subunit|nr:Clp protease ClpP [Lachnospiraceae bacterium]
MKKFWNWIHDDGGGRILRLEGPIDSENFWGDEITPQMFRKDLEAEEGDVTVWINSPGGNVFAAAEIYTMLKDYAGKVTVKVASLAASAASVVAMAGDTVQMSPTALLMLHDPSTVAMGNTRDMEKAIAALNEVKEAIVNAYAAKSGLRRGRIADLMSEETWLNAKKAVELGFADEVLYDGRKPEEDKDPEKEDALPAEAQLFSTRVMDMAILDRLGITRGTEEPPSAPVIGMDGKTKEGAMPFEILKNQLDFLR